MRLHLRGASIQASEPPEGGAMIMPGKPETIKLPRLHTLPPPSALQDDIGEDKRRRDNGWGAYGRQGPGRVDQQEQSADVYQEFQRTKETQIAVGIWPRVHDLKV